MEKLSYALGMVIGHNLKSMNVTSLNAADFAARTPTSKMLRLNKSSAPSSSNSRKNKARPCVLPARSSWKRMPRRTTSLFCQADCNTPFFAKVKDANQEQPTTCSVTTKARSSTALFSTLLTAAANLPLSRSTA